MVGFRAILEIGVQHTFPQKWPLSGSVDDRPQMADSRLVSLPANLPPFTPKKAGLRPPSSP